MMKKFCKIVLPILLLVLMVFTVASCDKKGTDIELSIKENSMPQLQYVVGMDLDLSNGVLLVTEKGETKEVSMADAAVTVSGYDKTKVGEQKVTLTYGEKTVEITVTVVERMQVIDAIADYLIGDAMDLSKGRIKITRNDGTSYTVALNHDKVTVEGYDSTSAGSKTLKVKYAASESETYEGSVAVTVHAVDNVSFRKPNKVTYNSHEGGLDVTGGILTLKGNDGKLQKDVALTADMVTGFDLNAVNETNSPFTQKLTVTYGTNTFTYDVKLTYTDISKFQKDAGQLKDLDWTGEDFPEISEEKGELALELIELYMDMSKAEQTYLSAEDALSVARAAMIYGMQVWAADIQTFDGAFMISAGELYLVCESYEAVKAAEQGLRDTTRDAYVVGELLIQLIDTFTEEEILTGVKFADFAVLSSESYETLADSFEYLIELADQLAVIPTDWRGKDLSTLTEEIDEVYNFLLNGGEELSTVSEMYQYAIAWREDGSALDCLYTYYYEQEDMESIRALSAIWLPSEFNELYLNIVLAMEQVNQISNFAQTDTTQLFYYYYSAVKLADQLRVSEDEMTRALYGELPLNTILGMDDSTLLYFDEVIEYLRVMEGGYYQMSGALLGIDEYHELMDQYMDIIIKLFDDEDYDGSAAYWTDLGEMFSMYVALSPAQQLNFLSSINAFYGMGIPPLAFEDSEVNEMTGCIFVELLDEYFETKLASDTLFTMYKDLMVASEIYAQRFSYEGWLDVFKTKMDSVIALYNSDSLSAVEKATFMNYLGEAYTKYSAVRGRFNDDFVAPDLTDWEQKIAALQEAILNVEIAYYVVDAYSTGYSLFFSAFERVQVLADNLLSNAPASVVDAYYHENLYTYEAEEGQEPVAWSLDYIIGLYRSIYITYQVSFMEQTSVYDVYNAGDASMADFFQKAYDLYWAYMYSDDDATTTDFNKARVLAALKAFKDMSLDAKTLFVVMEGETGFYYLALDAFVAESFNGGAAETVYKTLELEQRYLLYMNLPSTENYELLKTVLQEVKDLHEDMTTAEQLAFAEFAEIYDHYVDLCEAIVAEVEANQGV